MIASKSLLVAAALFSLLDGALGQTECITAGCCAQRPPANPARFVNACTPGNCEGKILDIISIPAGPFAGGVEVIVMGITVVVPLSSFTAGKVTSDSLVKLTPANVLPTGTNHLPGRLDDSFIGGTLLCRVTDIDEDGLLTGVVGHMVGRECLFEPAENVLTDVVTGIEVINAAADNCNLYVGGGTTLKVIPISDPRDIYQNATDANGFAIYTCSIPIGTVVSINGYYAADGNFYMWRCVAGAGTRKGPVFTTTISRVRCIAGTDIRVNGAVTNPAVRTVTITTGAGAVLGTATVTAFDPVLLSATFAFRAALRGAACPTQVKATATDGSFAIANV